MEFYNPRLTNLHKNIINKFIIFLRSESYKVGDKLPTEHYLTSMFNVSRSSMRVAVKYLVEQGILETRQGSGIYVSTPALSPQSLTEISDVAIVEQNESIYEQIMEFRAILEPAIAELAAERRTEEQLNKLKVIVCDQQKRLVMEEGDGNLDAQFHHAIAEATGNTLLVETMDKINQLYVGGRGDKLRDKEWRQFSVTAHLKILDAIEKQDKKECRKEVEEHIFKIYQNHQFFKKDEKC